MVWKLGRPEARGRTEDKEPGTPERVGWCGSWANRRKEEAGGRIDVDG